MTTTQEHAFCKNCGIEYTADKITSAFCSYACWKTYTEEMPHE